MNKLTFITGNKNKFGEAKSVVPELEMFDLDLIEVQGIDSKEVITHKLNEAKGKVEGSFVVEDNSLVLEALNGLPGPLIKWFLNTIGNVGLFKLAQSFNNFNASNKVTIGLLKEDGTQEFFEGEVKGKIVNPRGENGFGWDPIFQPDNSDKTYGEMTMDEKNKDSSRKIAFEKLKNYINL